MSKEDLSKETRDENVNNSDDSNERKTNRGISLALRYDVLRRFRCVKCGRSPATEAGVALHIDHISPWAKGGETIMENLQTLCSECNLGKSDKI